MFKFKYFDGTVISDKYDRVRDDIYLSLPDNIQDNELIIHNPQPDDYMKLTEFDVETITSCYDYFNKIVIDIVAPNPQNLVKKCNIDK